MENKTNVICEKANNSLTNIITACISLPEDKYSYVLGMLTGLNAIDIVAGDKDGNTIKKNL